MYNKEIKSISVNSDGLDKTIIYLTHISGKEYEYTFNNTDTLNNISISISNCIQEYTVEQRYNKLLKIKERLLK